jgi:hypothetical protein
MYNVTLRRVRVPLLQWKSGIKHYECVAIALVIQHAMRMRRIILPVASVVLPYFTAVCHKRHDFRRKKNIIEHKMCFLIFCYICLKRFAFREELSERCYHKSTQVFT